MARAPGLAAPTLTPFGGGGAGFGAFSIVDPGREAYLTFLKIENAWSNGQATDADYLAAMRVYANALPEGSSTRLNTEQRVFETTYRVERNVLVSQVDNGDRDLTDLLAYDQSHLAGLNQDSETYRDRLDLYRRTQQQVFSDGEEAITGRYQDGTLTTAQLQAWYREQGGQYADNPDLSDAITKRVHDLDGRVLDERDARTITDYNDGKITDDQFLVYAGAARARYATGTAQAREWDGRIDTAQQARAENGLLYRYGLSQKYAELQQFIQSNAGGGGRTSTSTTKRVVLGSDGKWHTVTSTSTKAYKPSAAEIAAHKRLAVQIADAKRQLVEIRAKIGATPDEGGWVSTDSMIRYYANRQTDLARGSSDWYAVQEKIDSLQDRKHAETVLSKQGIRITYPGGGGASAPTKAGTQGGAPPTPTSAAAGGGGGTASTAVGRNVSLDQFMASLAQVESGGRYDARNASSGAFGKYQIMPSNWPAWAERYLGNANAKQTPENQEAVARGRISEMYKHLKSWDAVAYKWLTGASGDIATNPAAWSASGRRYVTKVMGGLGLSAASAKPGATTTPALRTGATNKGKVGGLTQIVRVAEPSHRTGAEHIVTRATDFPANLDGQAFDRFYANYERAFNSGAEAFVDSSGGQPIAYFVGDDPLERIERMRQLDDLRVGYYTERAKAYEGTATEITAHNQLNTAVRDTAAHEYRILDTLAAGKGEVASKNINPLAGGVRLLDKTTASIVTELTAAQAAYDRGDFQTAYAHLQLAGHYLDVSTIGTGPAKGTRTDTAARLQAALGATEQAIAQISARFGGLSPEEALGQTGGGQFAKDLERLRNAPAELAEALGKGDELLTTIQGQVKVDPQGNAILDARGQVQLAEGWARFISASGKVDIKRLPPSGVDPQTGQITRLPDKMVKVVVKVGGSIEDAYATWAVGNVGYIRGSDGVNRAMMGKIVTVVSNGKEQTLFEDPLNPGHWSNSPVVFNQPQGFRAIAGPGGTTVYQFGTGRDAYSLQFDSKTGTYLVVHSRPAGILSGPVVDEPVGGAGDANVLDLLRQAGFTRDTQTAAGGGGFTDVTTPVFGLTPGEYAQYLNPNAAAAKRNQPAIPLTQRDAPWRDTYAAKVPKQPALPGQRARATGIPYVEETTESLRMEKFGIAPKAVPEGTPAPSASPDPFGRQVIAPRTLPATTKLPGIRLPQLSTDGRDELLAEKRLAATHPAPAPAPAPARAPVRNRRRTASKVPLRQPARTTTIARTPIATSKLTLLERV